VFPLCRQTLDGSPCATCPRPRWEMPRLRRRDRTFTRSAGPSRSGTSPRIAPRRRRDGAVEDERFGGFAMTAMSPRRTTVETLLLLYFTMSLFSLRSILMHTVAWMCEMTGAAWMA
jgi:hypothetical protein